MHKHNVPFAITGSTCPGQGSTMDTSCLITMDTTDPCTNVLTEVRSQFQEVMPMPMVHYSTTLRPTAMVWLALLMILRKSSTVLFAQSEINLKLATKLDS